MTPDETTRLTHLLAMTTSPHDGEALNACRLAWKFMKEHNLNFQDVIEGMAMPDALPPLEDAYQAGFQEGYAKGLADGKAAPRARPRSWQAVCREMLEDHADAITKWEEGFLDSFRSRGWHSPTERQRGVFERIADKLGIELPEEVQTEMGW